jgi:hypothetical protein
MGGIHSTENGHTQKVSAAMLAELTVFVMRDIFTFSRITFHGFGRFGPGLTIATSVDTLKLKGVMMIC